ncbi:hypothetical protein DW152_04065 [Dorea sp. AM13-35]|nr:hypothetical protein DW152_04065 [Dorea sp. AM13-35]
MKENEENTKKMDICFSIDRTDLYMWSNFPETTNSKCGNSKCEEDSGYKNRGSSFYGEKCGRLYGITLLEGA